MRKAIVTLAIGQGYRQAWRKFAQPNWSGYAARHGYDVFCFEEPLDSSERARDRPASWQKLLILGRPEVASHDVVVWVDADIVMNYLEAPCIASSRTSEKVGLCQPLGFPDTPYFELFNRRVRQHNVEFRRSRGLPLRRPDYGSRGLPDPGVRLNAGVMVLGRREHRQLLEHVYNSYEKPGPGMGYEQLPLSYELIRNDAYEVIDPKFNVVVRRFLQAFTQAYEVSDPFISGRVAMICSALSASYFLHFAGTQNWLNDLRYIDFDRLPVSLRTDRIAADLRRNLVASAAAARRAKGGA